MTKSLKLTDTQLVLLSAASQREDGLLVQPAHLKGGVATAVAERLLSAALVEEVAVGRDDPHWREDESGMRIGLKITAAGLTALGLSGETDGDLAGAAAAGPMALTSADGKAPSKDRPKQTVREGSKQALVLSLLERDLGATIADLTAATGWLPHTTRAALTGLRQKGHGITKARNAQGLTVYRISRAAQPAETTGSAEQLSSAL